LNGQSTPLAIAGAILIGAFPPLALIGVLPSSFALLAVTWAFTRANEPAPIPAMAFNVIWILATDTLVAVGLSLAAGLGLYEPVRILWYQQGLSVPGVVVISQYNEI